MSEVYLNEIEVEILQVFIKHKVFPNLMIAVALQELISKLEKAQEN